MAILSRGANARSSRICGHAKHARITAVTPSAQPSRSRPGERCWRTPPRELIDQQRSPKLFLSLWIQWFAQGSCRRASGRGRALVQSSVTPPVKSLATTTTVIRRASSTTLRAKGFAVSANSWSTNKSDIDRAFRHSKRIPQPFAWQRQDLAPENQRNLSLGDPQATLQQRFQLPDRERRFGDDRAREAFQIKHIQRQLR